MFGKDKSKSDDRFRVRKLWFVEEYYIYDVVGCEFLTCFGSREEAEVFCERLNKYFRAVNG